MTMPKLTTKTRAAAATLMFAIFGVIGVLVARNNLPIAWPAILFYAMLLWNDYYSIEHFSKIIPPGKTSQVVVDIILIILHFVSTLLFANPFLFTISMTILFILAVLKYAGRSSFRKEFPRAIPEGQDRRARRAHLRARARRNVLGYPWQSTIAWTVIFVCSSVYVIIINPLYKDTLGTS